MFLDYMTFIFSSWLDMLGLVQEFWISIHSLHTLKWVLKGKNHLSIYSLMSASRWNKLRLPVRMPVQVFLRRSLYAPMYVYLHF